MNYDTKQFLDLIDIYVSEETKKSRRNLSIIAFIIITSWFLNIQLNEVRLLGINPTNTSEISLIILGAIVLGYWLIMYLVSLKRDSEIQKEREIILEEKVIPIKSIYEKNQKQVSSGASAFLIQGYEEIKSAYELYETQKERTNKALKFTNTLNFTEKYVPIILSFSATTVLLCKYLQTI